MSPLRVVPACRVIRPCGDKPPVQLVELPGVKFERRPTLDGLGQVDDGHVFLCILLGSVSAAKWPRSTFSILLTVKDWPRLANRAGFPDALPEAVDVVFRDDRARDCLHHLSTRVVDTRSIVLRSLEYICQLCRSDAYFSHIPGRR